ncbi:hypothetical protein TTHERM_000491291 (macronuclear) [Tetrahymena thermophila SB210]|uniref:Uncharacterized protein n=1 Tax=Tetrahymena thermophila (strain SB210) TaxID=312017 RepID=W7XA55_TETTS|nr:hypothetical protein TTHERM_000491291 [Tetrahymena thermophila SB210]EWS74212.1 hypothetical protein TTHERM_000491291 [Tetrahymena thermophila SB210]|eukprot:XP_012653272.1 hypothetical protein TTHERM_000491291 [Tetrahymena thermophila SB210]
MNFLKKISILKAIIKKKLNKKQQKLQIKINIQRAKQEKQSKENKEKRNQKNQANKQESNKINKKIEKNKKVKQINTNTNTKQQYKRKEQIKYLQQIILTYFASIYFHYDKSKIKFFFRNLIQKKQLKSQFSDRQATIHFCQVLNNQYFFYYKIFLKKQIIILDLKIKSEMIFIQYLLFKFLFQIHYQLLNKKDACNIYLLLEIFNSYPNQFIFFFQLLFIGILQKHIFKICVLDVSLRLYKAFLQLLLKRCFSSIFQFLLRNFNQLTYTVKRRSLCFSAFFCL